MTPAFAAPASSWIDAITPRWLTGVLRAATVAEAAVLEIETRPLEVASAAGDLARLTGLRADTAAWPTWYLVTTEDRMIPPAAQRTMSQRAGSTVVEAAASHSAYVSQPAADHPVRHGRGNHLGTGNLVRIGGSGGSGLTMAAPD
jgi:hypothetical protein